MKDKVVIITGASSGIGKACALAFSRNGCKVVLAARNESILNEISRVIGKNCLVVPTDIKKEEDCKNLVNKTREHFGRIDVIIHSAGISMRAMFSETKLEVIHEVMDTNFFGTVYLTKFALPHILKTNGSIVGVSSVSGKKGLPCRTAYCASKFAMEGFLETLRIEYLSTGLHVLIARPGFTNSNIRANALDKNGFRQGESPREEKNMMSPEEVAKHIVQGVLKRKREIILTREGKLLIFLSKFFPGLTDKLVYNAMIREPLSPLRKNKN